MATVATTENHALPRANVRGGLTPFPEGEFVTLTNTPVFAEHETKARDGRTLKFGRSELQMIVNRCNRRIRETGDYAAITLGHTPSPEEKERGVKMPDLVGFAGPFRLGIIGEPGARQRYAILADQHIFKDEVNRVKKHPRRSPELWLEDTYQEMFLDPIALLGAEAPRLDMGILYSAHRHASQARKPRLVERYTACAPGPMNTFVASHGDKKDYAAEPFKTVTMVGTDPTGKRPPITIVGKAKPDAAKSTPAAPAQPEKKDYAAETSTLLNGAHPMLSPEDIGQIVDSLMQTAPMQWVQSQMAKDSAPAPADGIAPGALPDAGDMSGGPGAGATGQPPMGAGPPPAPPVAAPSTAPPDAGIVGDDNGEAPMGGPGAGDDEDDKKQPYAASGDFGGDRADGQTPSAGSVDASGSGDAAGSYPVQRGAVGKASYARHPSPEVLKYAKQVDTLQRRLNSEIEKRVNAERRETILAERQVRAFDETKMLERCKYSRMNDAAFNDTMDVLRESAPEIPIDITLPTFDSDDVPLARDRQQSGKEKYSMEQRAKAFRIAEASKIRGEEVLYEDVLAQVAAGKL